MDNQQSPRGRGGGAGARLGHGEHALGVVVAVALLVPRRRHVGWPARIARFTTATNARDWIPGIELEADPPRRLARADRL